MKLPPDQQTLIEDFKKGLDPDSAFAMAERLQKLEEGSADREDLQKQLDAANAKIGELEARPSTDELNEKLARIESERDEHARRADAAEAKAKEAPKKVTQKDAGPKARTFRPGVDLVAMSQEERNAHHADLLDQIEDADDVEIAFTDGKKEILSLGLHAVSGNVWKRTLQGLAMTVPIDLRGRDGQVRVEGYALLLDGKPAVHTMLDTPQTIAEGAHLRIDDIHF